MLSAAAHNPSWQNEVLDQRLDPQMLAKKLLCPQNSPMHQCSLPVEVLILVAVVVIVKVEIVVLVVVLVVRTVVMVLV